ncbi:MAG TPA: rubrerythrin [Candidatus Korarchaeota archaeon]|nr:rubrerythrin [Candidatus Korarchaeota archaeon]
MLSKIPINLDLVNEKDLDKEILRAGIIAELDAINLYEQMAAVTKDEKIRMILLDIAKEEKTHVGEFLALLLKLDEEQVKELEEGRKEVEELD